MRGAGEMVLRPARRGKTCKPRYNLIVYARPTHARVIVHDGRAFGRAFAEARRLHGLSQRAVAQRVQTTPQYIGMIERGERRAPARLVNALCDAIRATATERHQLLARWDQERGVLLGTPASALVLRIDEIVRALPPRDGATLQNVLFQLTELVSWSPRMLRDLERFVHELQAARARRTRPRPRRPPA
jgi:transcriptional regulator with XRE-family HTH domain